MLPIELALRHFDHVLNDVAVLALWTKHDNLCIVVDLHIVPCRPIEKIVGIHGFPLSVRIRRDKPSAQHDAPMRALAEISFQPHEERGCIYPLVKGEIFATDLVESEGVAEIHVLSDNGAGNAQLDVHLILRDAHVPFPLLPCPMWLRAECPARDRKTLPIA